MTKSKVEVKVVVSKNGPYLVSGDIPLAKQTIDSDAEGESQAWKEGAAFPRQATYALCRCGHSKTKPFCDGTHTKSRLSMAPRPRAASLTASRRS